MQSALCEMPSTCSAGLGCVPTGAKYCVSRTGSVQCPAGFSTRYLLDPAGAFNDTRGCTGCTCGAWQNPGCDGGAVLFDSTGCGGNQFGVPAQGTCEPLNGFQAKTANIALQATGGCLPSNPTATGQVTAQNPTTVCCEP
jgi:hypothetical protein